MSVPEGRQSLAHRGSAGLTERPSQALEGRPYSGVGSSNHVAQRRLSQRPTRDRIPRRAFEAGLETRPQISSCDDVFPGSGYTE